MAVFRFPSESVAEIFRITAPRVERVDLNALGFDWPEHVAVNAFHLLGRSKRKCPGKLVAR
jgi:hypothetical protein